MFYPIDIFTNPSYSQEVVDWAIRGIDNLALNRSDFQFDSLCKIGTSFICSPAALPGLCRHYPIAWGDQVRLIESTTNSPSFTAHDGDRFILDWFDVDSIDDIHLYFNDDDADMANPSDNSLFKIGLIMKSGKLSPECLDGIHSAIIAAYDAFHYDDSYKNGFDYFKSALECPIASNAIITDAISARHGDFSAITNTERLLDDLLMVIKTQPSKAELVFSLCGTFGSAEKNVNKKEIDLLLHLYLSDFIENEERITLSNLIHDLLKIRYPDNIELPPIIAIFIGEYHLDLNPEILDTKFFRAVMKSLIGDDYIRALSVNDMPNLKIFADPRMTKDAKGKIFSISSVYANSGNAAHPKLVMTPDGDIVNIMSLSADQIGVIASSDSVNDDYLNSVKVAILRTHQMSENHLGDIIKSSKFNIDFVKAISTQINLSSSMISEVIKCHHSTVSLELLSHKNADKNTVMSLIDVSMNDHIKPFNSKEIAEMFSHCNQLDANDLYELFNYCVNQSHNAFHKELAEVFAIKYIFSSVYCKSERNLGTQTIQLIETLRHISNVNTITSNDFELLEPHLTLDIATQLSQSRPFTTAPCYAEIYERLIAKALKDRVDLTTSLGTSRRKLLSI